ncbi:serine hydrolase [Rhodocytophaga aerolata]|uniref:Serine hydrolase n=1 Tax=Rhodocytophaga aerolata TaxID=455078 RepID=A0ABT8RGL8_9BACT|nr:serine hydrolase [Rhodocytophaga aerolata]MDO1451246.1 serine hydrolase [Rhodocytophaga aerolata]
MSNSTIKLLTLCLHILFQLSSVSSLQAQSLQAQSLQAQSKYDSVDNSIRNFMAEKKIPGFAACMVEDSTIIWSKSYGLADIARKIPMSLDGILNIGSISKTFTATAAMQLWEKGLLDLEADINVYSDITIRNPKYPDQPITLFQILTHTSSIIDGKAYQHSYSCGDPTVSLQEWINDNLTTEGKYYDGGNNYGDWPPGSKDSYSNVAFGLLGLIVEKVAKQPFNQYCREHIFKPLGMKNTGWFLHEIDTSKHIKPYAYVSKENRNALLKSKHLYVKGANFKAGSFVEHCLYSFPNYPDGLVRTSVRELSLFLTAMMNGGELKGNKILNKATLDKMLSLQIKGNPSQGLVWHTFEPLADTTTLWGHTGGDPGIITYLFFHPTERKGVITFQNNATDETSEIVKQLYLISK